MLRLNIEGATPRRPTQGEIDFQAALIAALLALAFGLIIRYVFSAPFIPELLAEFVFAKLPISIIEIGVGLLGPFAKQLAFIGCNIAYAAALWGLALIFLHHRLSNNYLSGIFLSIVTWVLVIAGIFPVIGAGLFGRYTRQGAAQSCIWIGLVSAAYGAAAFLLAAFFQHGISSATDGGDGTGRIHAVPDGDGRLPQMYRRLSGAVIERRKIASWIGYAVVGAALYDFGKALLPSFLSAAGRVRDGNGVFPNINGLAREVTATSDFYEVSKNAYDPEVDARRWRFKVAGLVENPLDLTLDEIEALPAVEQYATLECISNNVGGDLIGNALWRGVQLKDLIRKAGPKFGVVDVLLRAADGYTDSIPIDRAIADGTILAYQMNGAPLSPTHGFPLRLIVPGIYGMKNVKWITAVEPVNYDYKGYWQTRGWDDLAEYKTMSRIDVPSKTIHGQTTIAGIAFAGDRGISKVEVSTDGGNTWKTAQLKGPLSSYSWVLWSYDWMPESAGSRAVIVRATDGAGVTQTSQHSPPIPDGASGYDVRRIDAA
jgi:DMSO/TMAO reductase YedYZ molybdopterin-dependent catalytic subunit